MSTTRENHVDEHGNLIKVDEQKKYMEQPISFIDENGNPLRFDLQTQQWGEGEPGINAGGKFEGYTVYPINNGPDVDVHDNASAERRDRLYDKVYRDAESYFNAHPNERPKDGYSRRNAYITSYVNIQARKEMTRRIAEGKASNLEKAYVYQHATPDLTYNFSWEQLTGKTPLDAPEQQVLEEISRDRMTGIMKRQEEEYKKSVERGTNSIKNRVAEAQSLRYDIRSQNREVPQAEEALRKQKEQDKTMNLDEVNALIHHVVQEKSRGSR